MKTRHKIFFLAAGLFIASACTKDWLQPEAPSRYVPENVLKTEAGMRAQINDLCKGLRREMMGRSTNIRQSYEASDLAVQVNGSPRDYDSELIPSSSWPKTFWDSTYRQVSNAALIVSRVDDMDATQEVKDRIRATGNFFLAYWHYRLITTYGDVPMVIEETARPKLDFKTSSQRRIIATMISFLEFAVEHLPQSVAAGQVNRAAGYMLLTKYYLMDGQFEKAVESSTAVINYPGLALMKNRFGPLASTNNPKIPNPNVMTDLFYKYNASDPANTEQILVVQDYPNIPGSISAGGERMREHLVEWYTNNMDNNKGVDGQWGTGSGNISVVDGGTGGYGPLGLEADLQILWTGRGIGGQKKTWYFHHDIWADPAFASDMRHTAPNWYPMETLIYNRPGSNVFGQNLRRDFCKDTLRSWDCIVYNKTVVDDETRAATNFNMLGGHMNWYIYRLAEAYLMRAEALVWLNRGAEATADLNQIRTRAGAAPMSGVATLDDVLDERARELFLEEMRKHELTRIAYTMAKLGRNGYTLADIGTKNWFYDRQKTKNNIYFDLATQTGRNYPYNSRVYRMSPYHIYWPIPETAINDNTMARINQNYGYVGYEKNVKPEDI